MDSSIPRIFDPELMQIFRRRAARSFAKAPQSDGRDFLLRQAAADLQERLSLVNRRFERAVDIYSHTDLSADALQASGKIGAIERIESLPELAGARYPTRICSTEALILPASQADIITSLLALHTVNDVPGLLARLRRALKPDGLFLAVLCGAGTLGELRESLCQAESEIYGGITPHIAPFMDIRAAGALLQRAGFALPVADAETLTVHYKTMFDLMADLRAFGSQNALLERRRRPFSRRFFRRAAEIYAARFSDGAGRLKASFSFIWLSGWAPHPGQQKPLRPGSAQMPLAKILADSAK